MLLSMSIKWKWTHCAKPTNHFTLIPAPPQFICIRHKSLRASAANMLRNNQIISSHISYTTFRKHIYVNSRTHTHRERKRDRDPLYDVKCYLPLLKWQAFMVYVLFVSVAIFALPTAFIYFGVNGFHGKKWEIRWGSCNFQRRYFWTID